MYVTSYVEMKLETPESQSMHLFNEWYNKLKNCNVNISFFNISELSALSWLLLTYIYI